MAVENSPTSSTVSRPATPPAAFTMEEKTPADATNVDLALVATKTNDWGGRPACFHNTTQEILCVFIATMAMGANSILSGVTTVIPDFVARDLHMTQAELTWLTASASLASGSFLLFFGRVTDLFGQKSMIIASFLCFSVLSLGSGFVNDPIALDVLNALLGLTTAASVPPAQASLSMVYGQPSRRKNAAFACFSAGNPVGFAFGMIFGAIATQIFSWRAAYWLLAIMYVVLAVLAVFCMPKDTTPKRKMNRETLERFDPLGVVLTIGGIAMFSAALSLGSTAPEGWKTSYVLALLIIGAALIAAFIFWERKYKYPLMPMYIWKDRNFSLVMGILLLAFMAFPPASFFVALFFQRVWKYSAISTAVHVLPMVIMGITVNIFAGAFMHKINNKLLMFIGTAAYTLAYLLLALNRTSSSYWAFCFPAFCVIVIGADLEFCVANMYVMTSLPPDQQGIAGGILQTITKLFTTIGFGVITAVFDSVQKNPSLGGYYRDYPLSQPYSAGFFYCMASAALIIVLTAFQTIVTQGGKKRTKTASADATPPPQNSIKA